MVRTTLIVPALLVGLAVFSAPRSQAAETEVRKFNVSVDGNPAGQYTMTITKGDDGAVTANCEAHVKVKKVGITVYHYDFFANEKWKDGRLESLGSRCDDDGKKFEVTAAAGERGLTVKVNGREKTVSADSCLTSACFLPDVKRRGGELPLVEADNGAEIRGRIQPVGSGPMTVAGQSVEAAHYRLKCAVWHDVWYDGSGRQVRREWTEDGHKTVLELASVTKQ